MSYSHSITIRNGDFTQEFKIYKCDITGEEIPEDYGWYGNDSVQISLNGMEILIEDYIERNSNSVGIPGFLYLMQQRLTERLRPNRYIPKKMRQEILEKYKNKCCKCGSTKRLEIDHIKPIKLKGLSEIRNLQVLCKTCNLKKGAKCND